MPGPKKGGPRIGGRQKGTPNKLTANLKEMILGALAQNGGDAYLAQQAKENPSAYLQLLGRVLPHCIADHTGEGPPRLVITWQQGPPDPE